MYIFRVLCQVGRSQIIVLGSYAYSPDPMLGGKVPDNSTWALCTYHVPHIRCKSIVAGFYVYIQGFMADG